tara:strand:+ start:248 stop:595 length:348 start_codon:yes stop_codon:yes gene_type:complete
MIQNWHPTNAAYVWATITALITAATTTLSIITLFKPQSKRANRLTPSAFYLAAITGLSIAITRAILPWEEPNTGMGSPLAVLIGLIVYTFLGFVFISLPMITVARRASHANEYLL